MALETTINRVETAGNGITTAFPFPYYFLGDSDLVVLLVNDTTGVSVTQTITTHYTVAGAGVQAGGTVTMITAPASGETLVVYRDPAITQSLDLVENDTAPAEELEKGYDRLTMISQRLDEKLIRSITLADGDISGFDTEMPVSHTPDYALGVNAAGTAFEYKAITAIAGSAILASQAEAEAATNDVKYMSPLKTDQYYQANKRDIASQAEAEAGTDNVKGMTPLRSAQAIAALGSTTTFTKFDATSWTPTISWTAGISTKTGMWKQEDDFMYGRLMVQTSGTVTTANFEVTVPNSEAIDTAKLVSGVGTHARNMVGTAYMYDNSTGANTQLGVVFVQSSTLLRVAMAGSNAFVNATTPFTWASVDFISLDFRIPISGW